MSSTFAIVYPFLRSVVVTFAAFGALVLFGLYGNSGFLKYTPIGWLHAALDWLLANVGYRVHCSNNTTLWTHARRAFISNKVFNALCQNRVMKAVTTYICDSPNPLLQIVYVGLVGGGYVLFLRDIFPHMGPDFLPTHVWLSHVLVALTFGTFALVCSVDPGIVNARNVVQHAVSFPFDNLLYKPKVCATCNIERPARSKHCRICGYCVARYDHHCPWINGCVGERNVRWFLLFLFATSFICFYEGWLSYQLSARAYSSIARDYAERVRQHNRATGSNYSSSLPAQVALSSLLGEYATAVPLGLFCVMMGFVVFAFGSYHVYLVMRNTTTNETFKWSDVKSWLRSITWRRKKRVELLALRAKGEAPPAKPKKQPKQAKSEADSDEDDSDSEVESIDLPNEWQMSNVYNQGVFHNFGEVLWPKSLRTRTTAPTKQKTK